MSTRAHFSLFQTTASNMLSIKVGKYFLRSFLSEMSSQAKYKRTGYWKKDEMFLPLPGHSIDKKLLANFHV